MKTRNILSAMFSLALGLLAANTRAASWQESLARMPLNEHLTELTQSNAVQLMLGSLQKDATVKALIFMPGATDEFYFFKRASAKLANGTPTLLDAVTALTNQTQIRATFRPPFLLLHTAEDTTVPAEEIKNPDRVERLKKKAFVEHALYYDRDWDYLQPILTRRCSVWFRPELRSSDSFHFYRHSLAGWNLSCWEALEAISLAGQSTFRVEKIRITFEHQKYLPKESLDHK